MSHITGVVVTQNPATGVGPDHGNMGVNFPHLPAPIPNGAGQSPPGGTKLIILHFTNAVLPANNRIEVQLGYGTDVFTSADGTDFWTRPINVHAFAGQLIPVTYITDGAANGGALITEYARGERHDDEGIAGHDGYSNCDPFLKDGAYTEPRYDEFWFCDTVPNVPPNWENVACIPDGDIRKTVARSIGMFIGDHDGHISTCSVTLIAPDLVITAGHCISDAVESIKSMSVTFDYQTECNGAKPAAYNPVFHKVIRTVEYGTLGAGSLDYIILQLKIPPGGLGIPPIPMRPDLPAIGEQVFCVHHPNGAVKKVSRKHTEAYAVVDAVSSSFITVNLDVSGGSSGSGLFDTSGRFLGVLSNGPQCFLNYSPSATILDDIAATPVPSPARDVMIVFDRSGSMAGSAGTTPGKTKMDEAKEAASLFVQLIASGSGHRVGLVSFSSTASAPVDDHLGNVNPGQKNDLIGPSPFTTGKIGALAPGGMTSIGGGLQAAVNEFPAMGGGANKRTILLLTDGLQNTMPMINDVMNSLGGTDIHAIGYGSASGLNGALLTQLAQTHNGLYMRAGDGLVLRKFFALSFGNIFEAGALNDPEFILPAASNQAAPYHFSVCEEAMVTIVVGWETETAPVIYNIETPSGKIINWNEAGTEFAAGRTWRFTKVPLAFNGDQNGAWKIHVLRPAAGGEFPPPPSAIRYFINVIAKDGPVLKLKNKKRKFYTGDIINPKVALVKANGFAPHGGKVKLYVSKPANSLGDILSRSGLKQPSLENGDTLPARNFTLQQLEANDKTPVDIYNNEVFDLFDDGSHDDGAMEHDGIFGNPIPNLLQYEGNYTFRAVATYGEDCSGTREITWTVHVETGIDPLKTDIKTSVISLRNDGRQTVKIDFTPKDKYGNLLGPGRLDVFTLSGTTSTTVTGAVTDHNNGTYSVVAIHDPSSGSLPGIVINQEERSPVIVSPQSGAGAQDCSKWKRWMWLFLLLFILALLALIISLIN